MWGLNVRARSKVKDESNGTANVSAKGESSQRAYERPNKKEELDLESHPDEATEEAYLVRDAHIASLECVGVILATQDSESTSELIFWQDRKQY